MDIPIKDRLTKEKAGVAMIVNRKVHKYNVNIDGIVKNAILICTLFHINKKKNFNINFWIKKIII